MKLSSMIVLLSLGFAVSGCESVETSTRNSNNAQMPAATLRAPADTASAAKFNTLTFLDGESPVRVGTLRVIVPQSLKVSEANRYLPSGDIVWREDPIGNRHAQVQTIVQNAMNRGVKSLKGPVRVNVDIQITKFHALTEKARYSTGGVHAITFLMSVRSAKTGELVIPVRKVRADLVAFGGQLALEAEARGQTQKVRISDHLEEVIRQELTNPEGYRDATTGFIQAINYF